MHKAVLITGPTASGKTALAHKIAKSFKASSILNADSKQFYKDIHIANAKPSLLEQRSFSYHFLDFLGAFEAFSAYDYLQKALAFLSDMKKKNHFKLFSLLAGHRCIPVA